MADSAPESVGGGNELVDDAGNIRTEAVEALVLSAARVLVVLNYLGNQLSCEERAPAYETVGYDTYTNSLDVIELWADYLEIRNA